MNPNTLEVAIALAGIYFLFSRRNLRRKGSFDYRLCTAVVNRHGDIQTRPLVG